MFTNSVANDTLEGFRISLLSTE